MIDTGAGRIRIDWRLLLVFCLLAALGVSYLVVPPATHSPAARESTVEPVATAIWTSTSDLTAQENAERHFRKHNRDFKFRSMNDYVAAATAFLHNPPAGTLTKRQRDGDIVRFRPSTAEFAVMTASGVPRTYFRLNPDIHGYPTNQAYFDAQ